jgi:CelD/BcsL family acetyltransferase involved in cellulose biosynthesis
MAEFASSVVGADRGSPGLLSEVGHHSCPQDLQCEFIDDARRLSALSADWWRLWSSLPDATPFQSPDWILPWWNHFGEGPLFTFAFWHQRELVGLAPLYIFSTSNLRRVFLIGTGNTDYLDVIFHPEWRDRCASRLLSAVHERSNLWDECMLQRLRPQSPLLLQSARFRGLISQVQEQEPCPTLNLRSSQMAAMLKTARYYARKLEEKHSFSIERATAESLDEFLAALEQLHQARWQAKGLPSVLAIQRDRSFYSEVAKRFLRAGVLYMFALRIGEHIADVLYGVQWRSRMYLYLSAFDPAFARMSIGTVILGHVVQTATNEGLHYFDFLRGQEPYKYRWGAKDEVMFMNIIRKDR